MGAAGHRSGDRRAWDALRATVARHKAAIRQHRDELGEAKAALDAFEAECRQRGIAVTTVTAGAGEIHGHSRSRP